MKLAQFIVDGETRLGLAAERGLIDLSACGVRLTMEEIMADWRGAKQKLMPLLEDDSIPVMEPDSIVWAPPVQPTKICCVGLNYKLHVDEAGEEQPKYPMIFCKMPESLNSCGGVVPIPPRETVKMDFEAELVIVMGKKAYAVSPEEAGEYIFGYTCGNDVSDRQAQFISNQMLIGKGCPGFAPIGPYVVTADDINPVELDISCTVNGVRRQSSNTRHMIFKPWEIVSYISQYLVLNPGDIIYTGTPDGVIIGEPPEKQKWLSSGDEIVVEIEKIGKLKNYYI